MNNTDSWAGQGKNHTEWAKLGQQSRPCMDGAECWVRASCVKVGHDEPGATQTLEPHSHSAQSGRVDVASCPAQYLGMWLCGLGGIMNMAIASTLSVKCGC